MKQILQFFNPETINKNFKIIDAFHQMKNKKQEKHDKNGKKSHRSVLCCKNNINCNRNVAGNFLFFIQIFVLQVIVFLLI